METLLDIGNDLSEGGDEARAESYFLAAAERGSELGWYNLGNALSNQGRKKEAVSAYLHAVAAGVDDAPLNLGLAYQELADWPAAESAFQQAMAFGDPRGRLCLGSLWRFHGDQAAAETLWRQAANEGDNLCAAALGGWLLERGRPAEAEPLLRQAMDVDDARSDLGNLLRKGDQLDEAEALLRQGAADGHADSMIKLALLLEEDRGDSGAAEAVLRSAIAVGELFAHNNLGLLLRVRGALIEAQQQFQLGARGGDKLAARNLAKLRRTRRRELNSAHRRARKKLRRLASSPN